MPERLLSLFLSECRRANPDVHVHGFMGAPGGQPVDLQMASDLLRCIPGMSEAQWAEDVRRWIAGEQPDSPDELVIRRYAEWTFRGRGIRIGKSGYTAEEERRAAEAAREIIGGRRARRRSCLDMPPGGWEASGATAPGRGDGGWAE